MAAAATQCEAAEEAFLSLKGNLSMLGTYVKETTAAVEALDGDSASVQEALAPLVSTVGAVDTEARSLKKEIAKIRTHLED